MIGYFFSLERCNLLIKELFECLRKWLVLPPFPRLLPVDNLSLQYLYTTFFPTPRISNSSKSFQTIDVFCLFFLITASAPCSVFFFQHHYLCYPHCHQPQSRCRHFTTHKKSNVESKLITYLYQYLKSKRTQYYDNKK